MGKNKAFAYLKKFWHEPPKGRYLNLKEITCLGCAALGISFISNLIQIYITISQLPLIYDMGRYGTLHATVICLIASVSAMIITPIYGSAVQRTKSKFGRYKPYILFLAPIVSLLGVFAVWVPNIVAENARIAYVYCICVPTLFLWNLWFNSWNMFPGVYSPNRQERIDIWAPIGLVIGFAPTIMNMLKDIFAGFWGDIVAARIFGIVSCVVGIICIMGLLKVKERVFVTETESGSEKLGIIKGIKMVCKNKPLMILTLALVLGSMKGTIDLIWNVVARVKYATNVQDAAKLFGTLSMVVGFAVTPNMILLPLMTRKLNNRTIMIIWQACNTGALFILGCIGFQRFQPGTTSAIIITALRFVSTFNAVGSLQPIMLSEIADYQQHKSGYRLEGFIQTMAYTVPLVVTQVLVIVPAVIQGKIGFNPNNYIIDSAEKIVLPQELVDIADRYANIALWISFVSGALMLICLLFYSLDKKKHAQIIEELKQESVNTEEIVSEQGTVSIIGSASDTDADTGNTDGGQIDIGDVSNAEQAPLEPAEESLDERDGDL